MFLWILLLDRAALKHHRVYADKRINKEIKQSADVSLQNWEGGGGGGSGPKKPKATTNTNHYQKHFFI
jgi:hypothetical protein